MAEDEVVGTAVIRVVIDRADAERDIDRAVRDYDDRTVRGSRTTGDRSGKEYASAFERAVRTRSANILRALPKAEVDIDDDSAVAKLARLRATIEGMGEERLGIKLSDKEVYDNLIVLKAELETLTGPEHTIDIRANAKAALAEIAALRAAVGDVDPKPPKDTTPGKILRDAKDAESELGIMRIAIEQLGPPLVPVAGGALALGAGFVGLGAAGVAAIYGIKNEWKSATPVGQQFAGVVRSLKDDIQSTSEIAAKGVLPGFEAGVNKLEVAIPTINREIGSSSRALGDIVSHVVGGLVGGFETFTPLIREAEGYIEKASASFESWATGPGGEHFAATLSGDLEHLVPALENIVTLGVHLVSAFHPVGTVMLDNLTALTGVIDEIPVGVLQAAATAYIAFRSAVAVSKVFEIAAGSLTKFAKAETVAAAATTEAAAATAAAGGVGAAGAAEGAAAGAAARASLLQRTAGGIGLVTTKLLPYAAAWVGATIAINSAANATAKWRTSTDSLKGFLASETHFLQNILSFHPIKAFQDLIGESNAQVAAQRDQATAQGLINDLGQRGQASGFLGQFQAPDRQKVDTSWIPAARQQVASYTDKINANRDSLNQLIHEQYRLQESGRQDTAAFRQNQAEIASLEKWTSQLSASRLKLTNSISQTQKDLAAEKQHYQDITAAVNKARDAYRDVQAVRFGNLERTTFDKNPVLTSGVTGLQDYSKALTGAIKSEKSWTDVTDDNTVTIRGQTFETAAFDAEMAKTNNNRQKAIGLLLGHKAALADDQVALQGAVGMQNALSSAVGAAELKYKLTDTQLNAYAASLGITSEQLATGEISQRAFVQDVGLVKDVIDQADTSTQGWVDSLATFEQTIAQSGDTAAARAQLLASAMVSLNGSTLAYQNAGVAAAAVNQRLVDDFNQLHKGVLNLKTGSLDYHNAAAQPVLNDLQQLQTAAAGFAAAVYQDEVSQKGRARASKDAAHTYYNDTRNALIDERKQLGLTQPEAKKLADTYFHWPKNAITRLELMGTEGTNKLLEGIGEQLAILTHHPFIATLNADPTAAQGKIADLQARIDRIKQNKVPGLDADSQAAKDKIAELQARIDNLRDKTIHITADTSIIESPAFKRANNIGAYGMMSYAGGGIESHRPHMFSARANTVRVFAEPETGGEAYIPLAPDSRRGGAVGILKSVARRFGGDVVGLQSGGESGGYSGVTGTGKTGVSASSSKSGSSSTSNAASKRQQLISALNSALAGIFSAIGVSVQPWISAERQLMAAVKDFKGSQDVVAWLKSEDNRLNKEIAARNRVTRELSIARDHYKAELQLWKSLKSSTAQGVTGFFDIATAGQAAGQRKVSLGAIIAEAAQAKNKVLKFTQGIKQLLKEGLDKQYVMEIAAKGPDALPQVDALRQATPAQIARLNRIETTVRQQSRVAGTRVADYVYGEGVKTARALLKGFNPKNRELAKDVRELSNNLFGTGKISAKSLARGLESEDERMRKAVKHIADVIKNRLKKELGISSPSKVGIDIGSSTGIGVALGLESSLRRVDQASGRVGAASIAKLHADNRAQHPHGAFRDPRVDDLIVAMRDWFSHPPEIRTAEGQLLGRLVARDNNVLARLS